MPPLKQGARAAYLRAKVIPIRDPLPNRARVIALAMAEGPPPWLDAAAALMRAEIWTADQPPRVWMERLFVLATVVKQDVELAAISKRRARR